MPTINRALLQGYLDEALSDGEIAQVEKALRESEALRRLLRLIMQERDRGEHSLGAIWRRERLSCPTREQLGSFVLQVLDPDLQDYIAFHVKHIGCPYCQANLADLEDRQKESAPKVQERRRRFFESSAGYLNAGRPGRG
jgi:hypothetical protein